MHSIILFLDVIQVCAVLINLIATHHSLQEQEGVKVFIFPAGRVVEYADGGVDLLIVTDHQEAWVEYCFLHVVHLET